MVSSPQDWCPFLAHPTKLQHSANSWVHSKSTMAGRRERSNTWWPPIRPPPRESGDTGAMAGKIPALVTVFYPLTPIKAPSPQNPCNDPCSHACTWFTTRRAQIFRAFQRSFQERVGPTKGDFHSKSTTKWRIKRKTERKRRSRPIPFPPSLWLGGS